MMIFDGRWEGSHGIGRFATELHRRLPDMEYAKLSGVPSHPLDPLVLRRYLAAVKPELFFSPGYNPPLGRPCPFVFCVHDLNHLYIKENSSVLKRAYYKWIVRPSIRRAQIVITGSEFSKGQICEWSGARGDEVIAVGYGVSNAFSLDGPRHDDQGRPYFLCVGNNKAHKNLERSVKAFAMAFAGTGYRMIFTGAASDALQAVITRCEVGAQISFVGAVSDKQLASLYRGALALVFVSLYEGFGLPIIECMACGAPVLTSTTTAMPEAAGDAAMLVDPYDLDAISDGMRRLADDAALRASLSARGLSRAAIFSWDKIGAKVRDLLTACA